MNPSLFIDDWHKKFYFAILKRRSRKNDAHYRSLIYLFGLCRDTREHINDLFDFKGRSVKTDALYAGWQTGQTVRLTLFAFNLWNGWTAQGRKYLCTPYHLFNCDYAPYFWEAIKLRFPKHRSLMTSDDEAP